MNQRFRSKLPFSTHSSATADDSAEWFPNTELSNEPEPADAASTDESDDGQLISAISTIVDAEPSADGTARAGDASDSADDLQPSIRFQSEYSGVSTAAINPARLQSDARIIFIYFVTLCWLARTSFP